MMEAPRRDKLGRFAYGRSVFGSSGAPRAGRAIPPPRDWTHVYAKERGGLESCQGMRCKILATYSVGLVRVEFEDGRFAVVRAESVKPLPVMK